jgi:hypothetical protein
VGKYIAWGDIVGATMDGVGMNTEKFELLMNVVKILEKHSPEDENISACCRDIIDSWDKDMTADQKATILREFLNFRKRHDYYARKFADEDYNQHMKDFLRRSDWMTL